MADPRLSVRSARARELARRLALRECRRIADIVERALEAYDSAQVGSEPASSFYARLSRDHGADSIWMRSSRPSAAPIRWRWWVREWLQP